MTKILDILVWICWLVVGISEIINTPTRLGYTVMLICYLSTFALLIYKEHFYFDNNNNNPPLAI